MRRYLVLVFLSLFFLLFVTPSFAAENWVINNFQSQITLQSDGKVLVDETIDVNFGNPAKHGIYRDIPYIYYTDSGSNIYADVKVTSILQNGSPARYVQSKEGNYIRLKIGDPNITFSGRVEYKIQFVAKGILKSFQDHDELYWDVTGNGWPVSIAKVSAVVTLPQNGLTGLTCFEGVANAKEKCISQTIGQNKASFQSARPLQDSENLTIVVGFQKGMVPIITIAPPASTYSPSQNLPFYLPSGFAFIATLLGGFGLVYWLWRKKGQDIGGGSKDTIVVQYDAPDKMPPAIVGTILDERADTLDVTATIIDLAVRGFLTITEEPKKWLFGSTDYTLSKKNKDTAGLLDYEKLLFSKLFKDGETIKVSELQTEFYEDLADIKAKLYQEVVDKKYFAGNPEKVKNKYALFGVLILILGVVLLVFGFFVSSEMGGVGWSLLFVGVVFIIVAQSMPRRTDTGHQTYIKILGFRLFIDKVETYKQQYLERENIFSQILPYAIVFGVTEKFAKAFADLGIKPIQPTWYYSSRPFNPVLFSSGINNFSHSMTSAIASQPTRNSFVSSGSGFSSGGSSGGGFGGGGGGSW